MPKSEEARQMDEVLIMQVAHAVNQAVLRRNRQGHDDKMRAVVSNREIP